MDMHRCGLLFLRAVQRASQHKCKDITFCVSIVDFNQLDCPKFKDQRRTINCCVIGKINKVAELGAFSLAALTTC